MSEKSIDFFSDLRNAIFNVIGRDSFIWKSTITYIEIHKLSSNNYRKLIHFLKNEKAEIILLQSHKLFKVVNKNIYSTTDNAKISIVLEEIDFTVRRMTNIKHHQIKTPLLIFFIDLSPETISKEIFNKTS